MMHGLKALSAAGAILTLLLAAPPHAGAAESSLRLADVEIALHMEATSFELPQTAFERWIRQSARVVRHYYGRFPVPRLRIALIPTAGKGIKNGKAFGFGEAVINVRVGVESDRQDLQSGQPCQDHG